MRDSVYYLGFYNNQLISKENREFYPAADTKIDYVRTVISGLTKQVHMISASKTKNRKFAAGSLTQLNNNTDLKTFNSLGKGNKIKRIIDRIYLKLQLLLYLLSELNSDDVLVVYHSLSYMKIVSIAKKIKKFKLIEEVEEIYADVTGNGKTKSKEIKFFSLADGYIFSTQLLNNEINSLNKPYAVANGTYTAEPVLSEKFKDGKIHVVYAGTLDPRKGGAIAASAAAKFLPSNYHVHILGFGSDEQRQSIINIIAENNVDGHAKVTYDGLLVGEEFKRFIQSCDIGLSTQNPAASFNATSFPSKILAYMANGLRVMSIRIPAIESSKVGKFIHYYDDDDPKVIAKELIKIDYSDGYDGRSILNKLNFEFISEFQVLLK